ncbi:protein JOKA2-like [Henckelia pumila]|uniref:protein JOKA2-like n=1 Tax=Henckelia pumila TaxID=405737 RepID=UPI003C6E8C5C
MERNRESSAAMEASIVVKVKYGDVLRRFRSWISDDELDVSMDGLEEKILSLFNLPQNISLMLAYIDEDGDDVALVDDDDLRDVVKQGLNPLRVTVKRTAEKNGRKHHSSGTSTPLKLPQVQKPFLYKKTAAEPLCETLVKLSINFASKVSSSGHDIVEFINYFSEVSSSYLAYISESQPKMQIPTHSGDSEKAAAATEMKASETSTDAARSMVPLNVGSEEFMKQNESLEKLENESLEKVEPLTTVSNNAVRHGDTSVVSMKDLSATAPGFNAVGLDSQTTNAGQPVSDSLQNSVTTG